MEVSEPKSNPQKEHDWSEKKNDDVFPSPLFYRLKIQYTFYMHERRKRQCDNLTRGLKNIDRKSSWAFGSIASYLSFLQHDDPQSYPLTSLQNRVNDVARAIHWPNWAHSSPILALLRRLTSLRSTGWQQNPQRLRFGKLLGPPWWLV